MSSARQYSPNCPATTPLYSESPPALPLLRTAPHGPAMSFFFKAPLDIEIRLDNENNRDHINLKVAQGRTESLPIYEDGESVKGLVTVRLREGKAVEHLGVKVQLLGTIESPLDVITSSDFLSLATELASPATISGAESYRFEFRNVEKQHESYRGRNVRLRYYVRVVISRKKKLDITREKE